jgi:hypothetical protein
MSSPVSRLSIAILAVFCLTLALHARAWGQQEHAVLAGVQYLQGRAVNNQVGETAMIALAMLKADIPTTDPVLASCIAAIQQRFTSSGYSPQRRGGHDIYEAAVVAMVLANLESDANRGDINLIATYLIGRQNVNGSWDYTSRPHGDTSISQYALLGLWECENAGFEVPPNVWDRAASWYLSVQASGGSWNYHRDETSYLDNLSMTAAGVGSLLLCKRQLERLKRSRQGTNPLLSPLVPQNEYQGYKITTSFTEIDQAVRKGMAWLVANYTTTNPTLIGQSIYYGLYGIERVAALADRQTMGKVDLLEKGRNFIRSSQRPNGSWNASPQSDDMNTVWAILYLTKSTAKSLNRVVNKKLGAGTLVGGRYLPSDLTSMTVAGGRIMSRPMNGAVEGMLAVLEDPRAQNAETAVAGLIERYHKEGPDVLRPFKDRFRKMLTDRDHGVRQVAAWALARTSDLDVIPDLISALVDPEDQVVLAARQGLQLLSRKIDGLGPPDSATLDQRQEAAARWRAWYEAIRPLEASALEEDDFRKPSRRPQDSARPAQQPEAKPARRSSP